MDKERISISTIIDLMTEDAGFSRNAAEEFVYTFFTTIEEALLLGENVKIKGFGTFKLQWHEARESVDPHSGNEIIIPGFYVVDFIPEEELSEQLNEPFAHLEPFVLPTEELITDESASAAEEDDLFEEATSAPRGINTFAAQVDEIKDILSEIQSLSGKKQIETPKHAEKINDVSEQTIVAETSEIDTKDSFTPPPVQDEFDVVRDVSVIYGESAQEPNEKIEIIEEKKVIVPEIHKIVEQEEVVETNDQEEEIPEIGEDKAEETEEPVEPEVAAEIPLPIIPSVKTEEKEVNTQYQKRKRRRRYRLIISLVVLVAVTGAAAWFVPPYIVQKKKEGQNRLRLEYLADSVANVNQIQKIKDSLEQTRLSEAEAAATDSLGNELDEQDVPAVEEEQEEMQASVPAEEPKPAAKPEPAVAKGDIFKAQRVYKEFLATEKMSVGSQLTLFARKYYGSPHFWVYIYEANKSKIKDPNRVPAGIDIKIPKMDPRLVDAKDREALEFAKGLQRSYLE